MPGKISGITAVGRSATGAVEGVETGLGDGEGFCETTLAGTGLAAGTAFGLAGWAGVDFTAVGRTLCVASEVAAVDMAS